MRNFVHRWIWRKGQSLQDPSSWIESQCCNVYTHSSTILFLLFRPSFRINAIPFRACFWPRKDRRKFASSQRIFPRKKEGRRGFQFERAVPRNLRSSKTKKLGIGIRKFFSRCINLPLSLHFSDLPHSTLSIPLPSPSITLLAS